MNSCAAIDAIISVQPAGSGTANGTVSPTVCHHLITDHHRMGIAGGDRMDVKKVSVWISDSEEYG